MKQLSVLAVILGVRAYRAFVSPLLPPSCRFLPTCSEYAEDAFRTQGIVRGARLTLGRLLRCHPFCAGGFDPVPPRRGAELRRSIERPREGRTPQ